MKILAHRGYWGGKITDNTPEALRSALEHGYGFESDVRDYQGKLVISHNIAESESQDAGEVFQWLEEFSDEYTFAINIKADGLKNLLNEQIQKHGIKNYFTFDMSVPQMVEFAEMGLIYYTRQSEMERQPVLYDGAAGVWIDGFVDLDWITPEVLREHLDRKKTVCIVSPELHKRPHLSFWERIKGYELDWEHVILCTDLPDEAARFFVDKI